MRNSRKSCGEQKKSPANERLIGALSPEFLDRMAESLVHARSCLETVVDHVAIAHDLSAARLAFVSHFDTRQQLLAVVGVRGRADKNVVAVKPGEGPIGTAFSTGSCCGCEKELLAIPLLDNKTPIGVLSIVGAKRRLTPDLWRAFANHLVAAQKAIHARDLALRRNCDLETAVAGLRNLEHSRDELLKNVSHELKNPLTTIKAYLSMACRERLGELTEKQKYALEVCNRNADRLLRLINDLLLMARLQSGKMSLFDKPFGLRGIAREAFENVAQLASTEKIRLHLAPGREVFIKGDREKLTEAIALLLEHRILNNSSGGTVEMTLHATNGVACLEVKDTGKKIRSEDISDLFHGFSLNRKTGWRLGSTELSLTILKQVVQLHGGTVSVLDAPAEDTAFSIKLPLFAGIVDSNQDVFEPNDGAILIVEDDDDCREVLLQVLKSEGMRVIGTANSQEAIQILDHSIPALVLLDLRLGNQNDDGRLILLHIRQDHRLSHTPVFVISGSTESSAGFCYDGPEHIDGFFEKPLNMPRLLNRILEIVRPLSIAQTSSNANPSPDR